MTRLTAREALAHVRDLALRVPRGVERTPVNPIPTRSGARRRGESPPSYRDTYAEQVVRDEYRYAADILARVNAARIAAPLPSVLNGATLPAPDPSAPKAPVRSEPWS